MASAEEKRGRILCICPECLAVNRVIEVRLGQAVCGKCGVPLPGNTASKSLRYPVDGTAKQLTVLRWMTGGAITLAVAAVCFSTFSAKRAARNDTERDSRPSAPGENQLFHPLTLTPPIDTSKISDLKIMPVWASAPINKRGHLKPLKAPKKRPTPNSIHFVTQPDGPSASPQPTIIRTKTPELEIETVHNDPKNASLLVNQGSGSGLGSLTISNGTERSAIVKLVLQGHVAYEIFVTKGEDATIDAVDPGRYTIWYCFGRRWSQSQRRFLRDIAARRSDDPMEFTEEQTSTGTNYVKASITLHQVPYGNLSSSEVDLNEFNKLQ